MIEPYHPQLSIGQQCNLLSIARSSPYYEPKGKTEQNLDLMRQIDEQFLETPFFGVHQMTWREDLDGWERSVPRQHLHRAAVAHPEIRMRLPACLGNRIEDEGGHPEMDDLLPPPAPSFSLQRQATGAGLLTEK